MADEHPSDYATHSIPPPAPPRATLPPAAKTAQVIGGIVANIVRELAIIGAVTYALVAGKIDPSVFATVIGGVAVGHFALRKPEGSTDTASVIAAMRGT